MIDCGKSVQITLFLVGFGDHLGAKANLKHFGNYRGSCEDHKTNPIHTENIARGQDGHKFLKS